MLTADLSALLAAAHCDDRYATTTLRVAALAALAIKDDSLAFGLQWLSEQPTENRCGTGSRAYGTPKPDSDWDWVVLAPWPTNPFLARADIQSSAPYAYTGTKLLDGAYRFGPLNIIHTASPIMFGHWRTVTDKLRAVRPVTRETAVDSFKRAAYGPPKPLLTGPNSYD